MRSAQLQTTLFTVILAAALVVGAFWSTPRNTVAYILIGVLLLGTTTAILSIRETLTASTWSLAEALTEQVSIAVDDPANPGHKLISTTSKSSMSRLIALMGLMAILILYVCIGCACVWSLVQDGKFPDSALQGAAFLTSGLSLFVPYLANKATSS